MITCTTPSGDTIALSYTDFPCSDRQLWHQSLCSGYQWQCLLVHNLSELDHWYQKSCPVISPDIPSDVPRLSTLSPNHGNASTVITISGTGFEDDSGITCSFCGDNCATSPATFISPTSIQCQVVLYNRPTTSSTVSVQVTNDGYHISQNSLTFTIGKHSEPVVCLLITFFQMYQRLGSCLQLMDWTAQSLISLEVDS